MASSRSATIRTASGGRSWSRVTGVVAVEAEQGVEVDRSADLVLSRLAVRDAYRVDQAGLAVAAGDPDRGHAAAAGELAEAAFDGLLGASPQFARGVVPHDVGGVVVAVRAQRLAEPGIAGAVPGETGVVAAVRAAAGVAAGAAGLGRQVQRDRSAQVCWRTGREWTGPKDGAVTVANAAGCRPRRGDALAAGEPGAQEMVGVAAVGLGAAGADGGAAVPAGLVDGPVGHAEGGDGAQQFAGGGVDVLDVAVQPDRAGQAAAGQM